MKRSSQLFFTPILFATTILPATFPALAQSACSQNLSSDPIGTSQNLADMAQQFANNAAGSANQDAAAAGRADAALATARSNYNSSPSDATQAALSSAISKDNAATEQANLSADLAKRADENAQAAQDAAQASQDAFANGDPAGGQQYADVAYDRAFDADTNAFNANNVYVAPDMSSHECQDGAPSSIENC